MPPSLIAAAVPPVLVVCRPGPTGRSARTLSVPPPADTEHTLPGRLNLEWAQLSCSPGSARAVASWRDRAALAGAASPEQVRAQVGELDVPARDAVLLALLELAQAGDALAGRTVLQIMLGKAVRIAASVSGGAELGGQREEAVAVAVAALWQAIRTYPVAGRPSRVAANLALDTLALVQRGHTGSSRHRPVCPEVPVADLRALCEPEHHDPAPDQLSGPPDAQVFTVLAWAVRGGVLSLAEARLLSEVYGVDASGRAADVAAVAAQHGLSWPALRQRCHRLARRLRVAVATAGFAPAPPSTGVLAIAAA